MSESEQQATPWSWQRLRPWVTCITAALTVFGVDRLLTLRHPPRILTEVEEGVHALRTVDPTVLVLGSSHARTFEVMHRHVVERTGGAQRIAAVPVEFGKLSSYRWVFEHRLLPLLRTDATKVRRFILITEWWDSSPDLQGRRDGDRHVSLNVPSRGFRLSDFLADVAIHGLDDFNRNYLNQRFVRLCGDSVLVRDRGHRRLLRQLRGQDPDRPPAAEVERQTAMWRTMTEHADEIMLDPVEMSDLDATLGLARAAGLETTILLYPRKPDTMGERFRTVHQPRFAAAVADLARRHGARVIDLTFGSPIDDGDFAADFDHLNPGGNAKFCDFALAGELAFLLTPP